jgi:hypothetical protein
MGKQTPVAAPSILSTKFAFKRSRRAVRPPRKDKVSAKDEIPISYTS